MKKTVVLAALVHLFFFTFLTVAESKEYFVTQSGAGSRDGSNLKNAFSVFDFNSLSGTEYAGDTFYFNGEFSNRIIISNIEGTIGDPVILDGYASGDCDPLVSECSSAALCKSGLDVGSGKAGPDNIIIQDFRITNQVNTTPGLRIYPYISGDDNQKHIDNLIVRRNYVFQTNGTLFYYYSGRFSIIENNKIVNFGQNGTDATQGFNLIETDDLIVRNNIIGHDEKSYPSGCQSAEMIELHGCKRVLIENNDIFGAPSQSGIRPKEHVTNMEDIIIRFNKVHDNDNTTSGKGIYLRTRALPNDTISNVYIYGNYVYSNGIAGIMFGRGVHDIHVWSNIIEDNGRFGIDIWQGPADRINFNNNTIVQNGSLGETDQDRGGIVLAEGTNVKIKNNILSNNRPRGEDSKYNQIYSLIVPSSLESNTYHHSLSSPTVFYENEFKTLSMIQNIYGFENELPKGEVTNPGFIVDDFYQLNGTHINNGADLSKCFEVSIQGNNYTLCYNDALDPMNTDWKTTPPKVTTIKQEDFGEWERGAYVYPKNLKMLAAPAGVNVSPM